MSTDLKSLKEELRSFRSELQEQIIDNVARLEVDISNNDKHHTRREEAIEKDVKELQIAEAKRQGREGNSNQTPWGKIILGLIGIASAAIAFAMYVAQTLIKGVQ